MGDLNQIDFIKKNIQKFHAPYLEIGSRYGLTQEIRKLFSNSEYIGIDMEGGPGVDVVLDLAKNFEFVDKILKGRKFNTVFCYPSDYWRFTPEGIRILFPKIVFNFENSNMSTSDIGDIRKIDNDLCRIRLSASEFLRQRKYGMATTAAIIKLISRLGIAPWIFKYRYLLPPVLINMIGIKTGGQ